MDVVFVILALVRVVWTLYGQSGYIHPDEFFQSSEVMAGDILDYEVFTPWEFNKSHALRSVISPAVTSGVAFYTLKIMGRLFGEVATSSTLLLLAPRVVMVMLSFLGDLLMYKISVKLNRDPTICSFLYASSYVTLVFFTKTFSNTVEALLFSLVFYCVVMKVSKTDKLSTLMNGYVDFTPSIVLNTDIILAMTIVTGIFVRPTFAAFVLVPCIIWLLHDGLSAAPAKLFTATPVALITALTLAVIDSLYYGTLKFPLSWSVLTEMPSVDFFLKNLTFTPLKFMLYNQNTSNLALHGIHPRYTHVAVNMPMITAPLLLAGGLALATKLMPIIYRLLGWCRDKIIYKRRPLHPPVVPKVDYSTDIALALSVVLPLGILSLFPHQEMRFLLPLLAPCILLFARWMSSHFMIVLWILFNTLGISFFGIFHQGGLIPCLTYIGEQNSAEQFLIFHQTYMPPRHLLRRHKRVESAFSIVDLAGAPPSGLKTNLDQIFASPKVSKSIQNCVVKLVTPAIPSVLQKTKEYKSYSFELHKEFRPHLSMESPPDLGKLFKTNKGSWLSLLAELYKDLKLNLYCVTVHH